MLCIGDIIIIDNQTHTEYIVDRLHMTDPNLYHITGVEIASASGWVNENRLHLIRGVKRHKPTTEVEFLDAFKNNFKNGV